MIFDYCTISLSQYSLYVGEGNKMIRCFPNEHRGCFVQQVYKIRNQNNLSFVQAITPNDNIKNRSIYLETKYNIRILEFVHVDFCTSNKTNQDNLQKILVLLIRGEGI